MERFGAEQQNTKIYIYVLDIYIYTYIYLIHIAHKITWGV